MPWLTSPAFVISAAVATVFLIGLIAQRRYLRTRWLAALMLMLSVTTLACLALKTDATPALAPTPNSSGAHPAGSSDAGVPDPTVPGCTDPKTCGEPRPPGQPWFNDASVPDPLDPGCTDPKTCGEPKPHVQPQSSDAGIPEPLDPGCTDPKTCGEPRLPRPVVLDGGSH